uniref:Uncharacterized protein n=1 Tax=Anopheles merus TaxID=30066 RepID=A0A182VMS3_ANOME
MKLNSQTEQRRIKTTVSPRKSRSVTISITTVGELKESSNEDDEEDYEKDGAIDRVAEATKRKANGAKANDAVAMEVGGAGHTTLAKKAKQTLLYITIIVNTPRFKPSYIQ